MSLADQKLANIREQIDKGVAPPKESVRSLLIWFNSSRRGWRVCSEISESLKKHGLKTSPDFEYSYIDSLIQFLPDKDRKEQAENLGTGTAMADPTHRIGRLEAANQRPKSISPDTSLKEAVTLMLTHDFSQLPIMTGERDVKGIVSWKTIGSRLALKKDCILARDCMEPAQEIGFNDSLLSAINTIAAHDYVLVRAVDKKICGIITASDFNIQFRNLAEPFLLVGEIENGIRRLLHGKYSHQELATAKSPGDESRVIEGVSDLTFGEYIRLIESEKNWKKLRIEIDRAAFVKQLDKIREIRNDVMHFDPDGLAEDDLQTLREFARFLKRLRDVGVV